MMGSQSYMSSYSAQALETVTTPAGTFTNALHVREQRGSGVVRDVWYAPGVGMVMMDDGTQVDEALRATRCRAQWRSRPEAPRRCPSCPSTACGGTPTSRGPDIASRFSTA